MLHVYDCRYLYVPAYIFPVILIKETLAQPNDVTLKLTVWIGTTVARKGDGWALHMMKEETGELQYSKANIGQPPRKEVRKSSLKIKRGWCQESKAERGATGVSSAHTGESHREVSQEGTGDHRKVSWRRKGELNQIIMEPGETN